MKRLLFIIAMLWGVAYGQSTGYLRYDSVRIEKIGGNGELILMNSSRNVTGGVLTNIGNGRTAFLPPSGGGSGPSTLYYNAPLFAPNDSTLGIDTTHNNRVSMPTKTYIDSVLGGLSGGGISSLTGDVTASGTGAVAATIANDAVTYAKLQNISATNRFLGRITSGAGNAEELTGTQATSLLDVFTTSVKGLVPAATGGSTTTQFLRKDGTWAIPAGGGTIDGSGNSGQVAYFSGSTFTLASSPNFTYDGTQLLLTGSGTQSSLVAGAIEFQSLGANNGFISDNLYYDGSVNKRRSSGYGVLSYFTGGRYLIQTTTSSTAGSTATMSNRFIIANGGDFALGGGFTSASDYTGAMVTGISGKVGVLTNTLDSAFTVNGNSHVIGDLTVNDEAYDATAWNGSLEVPTKNAVRDKIESLGVGGGTPVANIGSGYRWLKPATQEIKTAFAGLDILIDSSSNTNGLTIKLDTATAFPQIRATIPGGSGSGTVNTGVAGKPAYYPSSGTTIDDFTPIDYATSGDNMLVTSQNATDIPFSIKGAASQSANLLQFRNSSGTVLTDISKGGGVQIYGGINDGRSANGLILEYDPNNDAAVIKSVTNGGSSRSLELQGSVITFTSSAANYGIISSGKMRIGSVTTPTAGLNLPASTTTVPSLNIPNGTAPTSPAQGDIWQASNHLVFRSNDGNSYQLDQQATFTNPMTTTGDIIYSSSGSTPARRAIGSTGQVLTVSGGVPTWIDPNGFTSATLETTNATPTNIVSIPTVSKESGIIEVFATGLSTSGDQIVKSFHFYYKNISGSLTTGNTGMASSSSHADSGLSTADVSSGASGTNVIITMTGVSATTIDWKINYIKTNVVIAD